MILPLCPFPFDLIRVEIRKAKFICNCVYMVRKVRCEQIGCCAYFRWFKALRKKVNCHNESRLLSPIAQVESDILRSRSTKIPRKGVMYDPHQICHILR